MPTIALSLNAFDRQHRHPNPAISSHYSLPTGPTGLGPQTITVAGHFTGTNAETGVERINFNGATYAGYALGAEDYTSSAAPTRPAAIPAPASTWRATPIANARANFVVGEQGRQRHHQRRRPPTTSCSAAPATTTWSAASATTCWSAAPTTTTSTPGSTALTGGLRERHRRRRHGRRRGQLTTYGIDDLLDVAIEAANEGTDTVVTVPGRAVDRQRMANVEKPDLIWASTPISSSAPATSTCN